MKPTEILAVLGGILGLVGGTLSVIRWVQDHRDRRRKRRGDSAYDTFVSAVVQGLSSGNGNAVNVTPEQHAWAARAVAEKRLEWGPMPNTVVLPGVINRDA